ncbi:unnamed protein product [Mytilus edulis]|uniref:Uncharacterized protein n=1 Tax=Mytilus edulis TaxID=6550 RepID=A0A8S3Q6Y6_MYTED|nr:unnamed protein product [Mytilus edulis]
MSGLPIEILNPKMISSFKESTELQSRNANLNIGLQHDVSGIFLKGLEKLRILDFAGNGIENLNPNLLRFSVYSLYSIDLSNKNFDDFPFKITGLKNLSYINLENNKIIGFDETVTNELDDLEIEKILPEDMPKSLLRIWNNVTCIEAEEYVSEENTPQFQHLFWKRLYQSIIA